MKISRTLYSTTALGLLLGLSLPGYVFAHGSAAPLVAESAAKQAEDRNSDVVQWLFNSFVNEAYAASIVAIDVKGAYRYIRSNGLPKHGTGRFPNGGNPNAIRAQSYRFKVPARPKLTGRISRLGRQPFGVAINGVVFDPGTAEYWQNNPRSGWRYEALGGAVRLGLDRNNAHVQPNGAYHYHAAPEGLMSRSNYQTKPMLIGWAADGFPIYTPFGFRDPKNSKSGMKQLKSGYRIKRGTRPQTVFHLREEDWAGLEREALDNPFSARLAGSSLPVVRPGQRFQCAEAKARGRAVPLVRPAGAGFQGAA